MRVFEVTTIEFRLNKRRISFKVVHNLSDKFGLNMHCAVNNWLTRTNDFTDKSLCEYIISKNTGDVCLTIGEWNSPNKYKN